MMNIIVLILTVVSLWLLGVYQQLLMNQDHVSKAWLMLDKELKTRSQLVPNLIGAIERYTLSHKEITTTLEEMKRVLTQKLNLGEREHVELSIQRLLHRLFLEIKSDTSLNHDDLIDDLLKKFDAIDEDVFLTRQIYNSAVLRAKTALNHFPANYLAICLEIEQPCFFDYPMTNQEIYKHMDIPKF